MENQILDKLNCKKNNIICIYGPNGCGKTYEINKLLEGKFNIINLDPTEKYNIDDINNRNNIEYIFNNNLNGNIIIIDNLLQDNHNKFINELLSNVFNIPIILIFTTYNDKLNINIKNLQIEYIKYDYKDNDFYINFINKYKGQSIELSDNDVNIILNKSRKDLRQIKYILEQLPYKSLEHIENIDIDYDLGYRVDYLLNNKQFDIIETSHIASVDTYALHFNLYQNYINTDIDNNKMSEITKCFAIGDIYNKLLYEDQKWELYDDYIFNSVVYPSFILQTNSKSNLKKLESHKEISHNIRNSYRELNSCKLKHIPLTELYYIATILISYINDITIYINTFKKGKNTSKNEKVDICKKYKCEKINKLVDTIYLYEFYNIDSDRVDLSEDINTGIDKKLKNIDIKKTTRFINIFSRNLNKDLQIKLKPLIETVIKYNLLTKLKSEYKNKVIVKTEIDIEKNTVNLNNIWNF